MPWLRVSKYNPELRDAAGRYIRDEWTSVSDIGRRYRDEPLTTEQYLRTEDAYVEAVLALMRLAGVASLRIRIVERTVSTGSKADRLPLEPWCLPTDFNAGDEVSSGNLQSLIRLCLRERMWCDLSAGRRLRLIFADDYYILARLPTERMAKLDRLPLPAGIFAERIERPLLGA